MEILYLLVPLSVVLVFLIGAVFWFAVKSGQFDDLEGPALRMLADDDRPRGAFDPDQMRPPAGRYDDPPAAKGPAATRKTRHAATRDL
jgi:cbb3-type cytochrome oxidase maturation protein